MGIQKVRFVRCGLGRVGFEPDESTDSLCPTAYLSDIAPYRVRPVMARKRSSGRRGCRFVGEYGLGHIQSLPQYILEGVRKLEDVCRGIL